MDILKEISKTQLVVIVTHEVSLIKKYADSHIKIVDGELVEDGEIEENPTSRPQLTIAFKRGTKRMAF